MTDRRNRAGTAAADFEATYRSEIHALTALATTLTGDRELAADLVHEAMMRAYRSWAEVATLDRPGAWIRRVLVNLAIDAHRRRGRERGVLARIGAAPAPPSPGPDAADRLDADRFWAAVRELPDRQRAVVALRYLDDVGVAEIAHVLDVSEGTVKTSLHRARHRLAAVLGPQLGIAVDTPEVTR